MSPNYDASPNPVAASRSGTTRAAGIAKWVGYVALLLIARPLRDLWRKARRSHHVRIFAYHRLADRPADGMTVAPGVFAEQIAYIRRYHDIVGLHRALEAIRAGARLRRPLAVITFDDAYMSVFERAFPILRQSGCTAHCFVCSGMVGSNRRYAHDHAVRREADTLVMGWLELQTLRDSGWEFGSHSVTHARLAELDERSLRRELVDSRVQLQRRLGGPVSTLAYPFGGRTDMSAAARRLAIRLGYQAVLSDYGGDNRTGSDPLWLRRIDLGGPHPSYAWKAWSHGLTLAGLRRRAQA